MSAPVTAVRTGVHRFPTPTPEADGTLEWNATTAVTAELTAAGCTGLGWTYSSAPAATLVDVELADVAQVEIGEAWGRRPDRDLARVLHAPVAAALPELRHVEWFADHARLKPLLVDGAPAVEDGSPAVPTGPGHGMRLRAGAERWRVA